MNSNTESNGITALKVFLAERSNIDAGKITTDDKTPIWDGHIYLYNKQSKYHATDDLIGRVPVQIKSEKFKKSWKTIEKYPVKTSHLRNYKTEGGVFFIKVVYKDIKNPRIYGKLLFPVQIAPLLKTNNQTHTIQLEQITTVDNFQHKLQYFIDQQQMQKGKMILDSNMIIPGEYVATGHATSDIQQFLFSPDTLFYKKNELGDFTPVYLKVIEVQRRHCTSIEVNGEVFFNEISVTTDDKGKQYVRLNSIVSLTLKDKKVSFNVKNDADSIIADFFTVIDFIRAVKEYGSISINGIRVDEFEGLSSSFDEADFTKWTAVRDLLELFYVDYSAITFQQISEHINVVERLVRVLFHDEHAILHDKADRKILLKSEKFFGKNILLLFQRAEKGKYLVSDFMSDSIGSVAIKKNEQMFYCSQYLLPAFFFAEKNISDIFIGQEEKVKKDLFDKFQTSLSDAYIHLFLLTLSKYDTCGASSLLDLSDSLIDFLLEKINDPRVADTCFMNKMQILARKNNELSKEEIGRLIAIRDNMDNDFKTKCAVNVLLKNPAEARYLFDQLTENDKLMFKSWPIYHLYNKLSSGKLQ